MEVLAMPLHPRERWKLRQIEVVLRKDDPGLDALLAGRRLLRRPVLHSRQARLQMACLLLAFLVPVALLAAGLVLDITWLLVAGAVLCPFAPVITGLLIRRRSVDKGASHCREP
ncbi:MAG TPA: DUF3040 domain-containing protein [Trebonia sp.]|jgi:hypothetical protein|nr:DUF3040 domain-containing protein [Trebonia sp.]